MKAAELLGLNEIRFVEPNYESLLDDSYSSLIHHREAEEAILLVDEEEWPIAFIIKVGERWVGTNFLIRRPPAEIFDRFERIGGTIFQENWETWMDAVREYYSLQLMNEITPALDDLSKERYSKIVDLIREVWDSGQGELCLDACCGSGGGAAAMRELGYSPIAYDNDASLLSLGLRSGRLIPSRTMCIDGTLASLYMGPVEKGLILMAGTIDPVNAWIWERIVGQVLTLAKSVMITVGEKREAEFVETWCRKRGRNVDIFENVRDAFYDRWVCVIERS